MADAYCSVTALAHRKDLTLRQAAYAIAVGRVAHAIRLRGFV